MTSLFSSLVRWGRRLGLALLGLLILATLYAAVAYVGWQSGQNARQQTAQATLEIEIEHQLDLAQAEVASGQAERALERLAWVSTQTPDHATAAHLWQQAESQRLRPSPTARPTLTPWPTLAAGPTESATGDPAQRLVGLEQHIAQQRWEEAIPQLIAFQLDYPAYEREQTNLWLYTAYLEAGLALTLGDRVELGLAHLEAAARLGDLPQVAIDRRNLAQLYLNGLAFSYVDWRIVVDNFRLLCQLSPFYQDSCQLLFNALVAYADELGAAQEWCPAVAHYNEATQYDANAELIDKLRAARLACLAATPTPLPTPTP